MTEVCGDSLFYKKESRLPCGYRVVLFSGFRVPSVCMRMEGGLFWRKSPHPGSRQPERSERADSAGTPLPGIVQSIASWFRAIRIHCSKSIQQTTPFHDRIFVTQAERSFLWLPHQYFGEKSIFIYFVTAYN